MKNFNNLVKQILETMSVGSVLGGGVSSSPGQSSDTYASGDARVPSILGVKKSKKKKLKKESIPVTRRQFPGM